MLIYVYCYFCTREDLQRWISDEVFCVQFKTNLVVAIYAVVVTGGILLLIYFAEKNKKAFISVIVLLYSYAIMTIMLTIWLWFLYKNIKNLIYLSKDKALWAHD
jgi:ABC-type arginine/histidine transport system permease subunit